MNKAGAVPLGHFIYADNCLWVGWAAPPTQVSVCMCSCECKHPHSGHYTKRQQGPRGWKHRPRPTSAGVKGVQ